MELEKKGMVE